MKRITAAGNLFVRIVTGILAVFFFAYGGLMLWDMFRTDIRAFASYDLLKYRPNIEENEPPYLDELLDINRDTAGWITIYNTNIDYPVMQGKDDAEYLNKDVYGDFSMSGSIYMASHNSKDFSDPYTLVYGHHMANGSMFGDILKFKEKGFFDGNDKGILIMPEMVYDLRIMACLETDAYDHEVFRPDKEEAETFVDYVRINALFFRNEEYEHIMALSTCDDATSAGRTVLICAMTTRTDPLPDREYGEPIPHRQAVGHPMAGAYWSLINLMTLLATFYFVSRLIWISRREMRIRLILPETVLMLCSAVLFFMTEDMRRPIQLTDVWTPLMIALLAAAWLIGYRFEIKESNNTETVSIIE